MRQSGESLEMQNKCAEIKIRAERRAWELLKEGQENGEIRDKGRPEKILHEAILIDTPKTLAELDIEPTAAHRRQTLADVPEEVFEKHIQEKILSKEIGNW